MCIRLKGDVIRQLNDVYEDIYFKQRYKEELKERLLNFLDAKIMRGEETIVEKLKKSHKYMSIEEHEIKIIKEEFINEYKEELFNSFNPLWYSNIKKNKKNLSKEAFVYFFKKVNDLFEKKRKYSRFHSYMFDSFKKNEINYTFPFVKENNTIDISLEGKISEGLNINSDEEMMKTINYFKKYKKEASLKNFEKYLNEFVGYLEKCGSSFIFNFPVFETDRSLREAGNDISIQKRYRLAYIFENKKEYAYLVDFNSCEFKQTEKTFEESIFISDRNKEFKTRNDQANEIKIFFMLLDYLFPEKKYDVILSNNFESELEKKFDEIIKLFQN